DERALIGERVVRLRLRNRRREDEDQDQRRRAECRETADDTHEQWYVVYSFRRSIPPYKTKNAALEEASPWPRCSCFRSLVSRTCTRSAPTMWSTAVCAPRALIRSDIRVTCSGPSGASATGT